MPRTARIDIPGLLQHVIVRGIERRDIFLDDTDKAFFLERLSDLLAKTETDCLAWALMPNHLHLLLRPRKNRLSTLMRRLLTGYAVVFNLRHKRKGHLFQNRYKSIVCQAEPYLLELVRYIHLNPLRAGLVDSLDMLDSYKWCGHAVVMGNGEYAGQSVEEVLLMFDRRLAIARGRYRQFVAEGIPLGTRNELVGGGVRSSLQLTGPEGEEASDGRILGNGEFVVRLRQETDSAESAPATISFEELIVRVSRVLAVEPTALRQGGRSKGLSDARGVLSYIAVRKMGLTGAFVARMLHLTRSGVLVAVRRGEIIYSENQELRDMLSNS